MQKLEVLQQLVSAVKSSIRQSDLRLDFGSNCIKFLVIAYILLLLFA